MTTFSLSLRKAMSLSVSFWWCCCFLMEIILHFHRLSIRLKNNFLFKIGQKYKDNKKHFFVSLNFQPEVYRLQNCSFNYEIAKEHRWSWTKLFFAKKSLATNILTFQVRNIRTVSPAVGFCQPVFVVCLFQFKCILARSLHSVAVTGRCISLQFSHFQWQCVCWFVSTLFISNHVPL